MFLIVMESSDIFTSCAFTICILIAEELIPTPQQVFSIVFHHIK